MASLEVFDPRTGRFSAAGTMSTSRIEHTATVLPDGRVLLAGGMNDEGGWLNTAEIWNPTTGAVTPTGPMTGPRPGGSAVLLRDGRVFIAGRTGGSFLVAVSTSFAEIFDPATGAFTSAGSPAGEADGYMFGAASAVELADGRVLVAEADPGTRHAELYDPTNRTWSKTGSMLMSRPARSATLLNNGRVLFAGGVPDSGSGPTATSELYDPTSGTFRATGSMAQPRAGQCTTSLADGRVLISGGWDGSAALRSAEIYDAATGKFLPAGSMTVSRWGHTATLLPNGLVLMAGGGDGNSDRTDAELFNPPARR